MLDVVISRLDSSPAVSIVACLDTELSDHMLLEWSVDASRGNKVIEQYVMAHLWGRLDIENFRATVAKSPLCQSEAWPDDIDRLAELYDVTLTAILDDLLPTHRRVRKPRPSDPWFDAECRDTKRLTRRLERAYIAAVKRADLSLPSAEAAWRSQRRAYGDLRQKKRHDFWSKVIDSK
jgi:hypothetical protein